MSGKQTGKVWELDLPHNLLWVLQALADNAHHDGSHCFPGDELLAWKTGYDMRTIKRLLKQLREMHVVEVVNEGGGRGHRTEYQLHLDRAPQKEAFYPGCIRAGQRRRGKGDKTPPIETVAPGSRNGDNRAAERVTAGSRNGDSHARARTNRQEPLDGSVTNPPSRALAHVGGGEGGIPIVVPKGASPRTRDRLIRTAERTGARLIHETTTSTNGGQNVP